MTVTVCPTEAERVAVKVALDAVSSAVVTSLINKAATGTTVTVTVAVPETRAPSVDLKLKVSVPVKLLAGV